MSGIDKLIIGDILPSMASKYLREDGTVTRTIPVRLPQEVWQHYEARAAAEDFTVGQWVKRVLVRLAKSELKAEGDSAPGQSS